MKTLLIGCLSILLACIDQCASAAIPKELLGDWQGVLQCVDSEIHFTLGLSEQDGRLSGNLNYKAVSGQRMGADHSAKLMGNAESFGNSLSIEGLISSINSQILIRMAYDEQKDRLFGKFDFANFERCSHALAERKGANNLHKELNKITRSQPTITKSKNFQKCDRDIQQWLGQIKNNNAPDSQGVMPMTLHLLQDENFKPYFGKNVFSLSDAKASELGYKLMYGCRDQASGNPQLLGALKGYLWGSYPQSRMNLWLDSQSSDAANRWITKIKKDIQNGRQASSVDDIDWLRHNLPAFQMLALVPVKAVDKDLLAFRTAQAYQAQNGKLEALMKQEPTWTNLLALTKVNPSRDIDPETRRQMIETVRAHIAKHWRPAIEQFTAEKHALDIVHAQFVPLSRQSGVASMLHYLPAGAAGIIDNRILERRLELATGFAAHETENYLRTFPDPGNYVASLERWNQVELELKQKYQELLLDPPFREFNAQRRAHLNTLIEKGHSALLFEIGQIGSPAALDAWFERHFSWNLMDEDARILRNTLRLNRLADIAPFYGANNEEYFNAIFRGDLNRVRQLEQEYLGATEHKNLLPGVIAVYLLEYESSRTHACLRSDAVAVDVIKTRPGTVTRNGLGVEIGRTAESTTRKQHRVNKEFERVLPTINPTAVSPGGGFTGFVGIAVEKLHNSTRRIMDTYPCDSIQIKTLEKNFIRLYEQLR